MWELVTYMYKETKLQWLIDLYLILLSDLQIDRMPYIDIFGPKSHMLPDVHELYSNASSLGQIVEPKIGVANAY